MYGTGILKGMGVTLKHFVDSYVDDIRWLQKGGRYSGPEALRVRQSLQGEGMITVMYPEEKLEAPERFRFIPFLITDEAAPGQTYGTDWCTSCGICAKVCPPQCIWIKRGKLPNGRPNPQPEEFYIDIDICMNCGLCAEFCPFDAIKMDHDFELASFDRTKAHIHDKARLSKPISYWRTIAPSRAEDERLLREADANKKAAKKGGGAKKSEAAVAQAKANQDAKSAAPVAGASGAPPPPEMIAITDAMSDSEKRSAKIANAKTKSAYKKQLKALGIDPKSVKI